MGQAFFNGFGGIRNPSPLSDPMGLSHAAAAKRANRTRFTDYQIKVLQEFFENNAYPKDDDLEYLSKLLGLSPRVIVVWFQNARQKARKIYENQPPIDPQDEGAGRFTRTPGLNYQCKKCLLVFQRYYELIRHQKQHCYKEEDAKRSAIAQRAAAQAAAQFVGQASFNSSMTATSRTDSESGSVLREHNIMSPISSPSVEIAGNPMDIEDIPSTDHHNVRTPLQKFFDEKKNLGTLFEKKNQEDRVIKYLNEAHMNLMSRYPANSHLTFLQRQGGLSDIIDMDELSNDSSTGPQGSNNMKRKLSEDGDDVERDENGQPKDKRLRTTILPEQLDYLYQKYQVESNPSRKMLEQIAAEVGLRKRVVQVWFQNTRARERKGQFRAHQQVINKRCPYCPAIFKVRSALESHLITKHAGQFGRGEINIDSLPDVGNTEEALTGVSVMPAVTSAGLSGRSTLFPSIPCPSSPEASASDDLPPLIPSSRKNHSPSEFEASMRKYYEETMKQFITDVRLSQQESASATDSQERDSEALDLSSPPLKQQEDSNQDGVVDKHCSGNNKSQVVNLGSDLALSSPRSESRLVCELDDSLMLSCSYGLDSGAAGRVADGLLDGRKKFRTQIMHNQVKILKAIFEVYKTPSMPECQQLADFIGLQKRVVQVWFQNARAKEKKARLHLQEITGGQEGTNETPFPEECTFCAYCYSSKDKVQEHIFKQQHLENLRAAIETGQYEPETPGAKLQCLISGRSQAIGAPATPVISFEQNLECLAEKDRERDKNECEKQCEDPESTGLSTLPTSSTIPNEPSAHHHQQYNNHQSQNQHIPHYNRPDQQGFSFSMQQLPHQQRKFYEHPVTYGREVMHDYNQSNGSGSGGSGPTVLMGSVTDYTSGPPPYPLSDYAHHGLHPHGGGLQHLHQSHHYPGPYAQNGYGGPNSGAAGGIFSPHSYGSGFAFQPGVPN
jgi:AT-binding transcription factor 1